MSDDGAVLAVMVETGVLTLTLQRAAKRNALNRALLMALGEELDKAQRDGQVRVVILQADPPVFCAGMDLVEASDPEMGPQLAQMIERVLKRLYAAPFATIACLRGAALAGGAGLASACDFVLAAEGTKIGYPEVQRGLVASMVMALLRRQIPERRAKELLLLGDAIDANEARQIGLVTRVVPGESLEMEAQELAHRLLRSSPTAVAESKALLSKLWPTAFADDLAAALDHHLRIRDTADFREGLSAFEEKRPPKWTPSHS